MKDSEPPRIGRWGRFSLRTLLIVITVCAVAFGWLGRVVYQNNRRESAIAALEQRGFLVQSLPRPLPWRLDKYSPVVFSYHPATVTAQKSAPQFDPQLDDRRTAHLQSLGAPPFAERDLQQLAALGEISELSFPYAPLTDDGLAYIEHLRGLKSLDLCRFEELTSTSQPHITDAGLKRLHQLHDLTTLALLNSAITDAGLTELLSHLDQIEWLLLDKTQISDASIPALLRQEKLRVLMIRQTLISDEGFEQLKAGLPDCDVCR